eukprot:gene2858-3488_t
MFIYDLVFVFGSAVLLSGPSVMEQVAIGREDRPEDFCEKYPDDSYCDIGAEAALGLGDVLVPGLVLAWLARLDSTLLGPLLLPPPLFSSSCNGAGNWIRRGLFLPALCAYLLGLILANSAAEHFQTGQPALLYICPLVMATVCIRAGVKGTLPQLWKGGEGEAHHAEDSGSGSGSVSDLVSSQSPLLPVTSTG